MKQKQFFIFLWILSSGLISLSASATIDYNTNCKQAYKHCLSMEFDRMEKIISSTTKLQPKNPVPYCISAYGSFIQYVTTENQQSLTDFEFKYNQSLDLLEDENEENPYRLYLMTDLYLQSAIVNLLNNNYLTALIKIKKAYSSIHINQEKFPNFALNNKALGLLNISLGSIPKSYNWTLKLLDMDGNLKKGYLQLEQLLDLSRENKQYHYLFVENVLLYTFTQNNFGNQSNDKLQSIMEDKDLIIKYSDNQLFTFTKVSYFQHRKQNEKALTALSRIQANYNKSKYKIFYLDYMYGESLLYKQEAACSTYFQRYIQQYPGQNYIRAAKQKMAWIALLQEDEKSMTSYQMQIINSGNTLFDADKQALKEAKSNEITNTYLLKSRLFFDGGYYGKADTLLREGFIAGAFTSQHDKIEYIYRLARIYDEWGNFILAEIYYKTTIEKGRNTQYYFAANAALQLGYRYEENKRIDEARKMFQLCLELEFDEYQNSITQKAKAGLNRIGNK